MDLADSWLGVPKLLTPEEIINPNVDEQSMMTYLSQFPNAKVKEGAPFREKALASKVIGVNEHAKFWFKTLVKFIFALALLELFHQFYYF